MHFIPIWIYWCLMELEEQLILSQIRSSQNLLIKGNSLISFRINQIVFNSQKQLIYFQSQKRNDQKNYNFFSIPYKIFQTME